MHEFVLFKNVSKLSFPFFRRAVYGANEIIVPMRSITALLFLEILNPFYIFQIFSFTLWMVDDYVYYALAILLMSCCSITVAVAQTRRVSISTIILFVHIVFFSLLYLEYRLKLDESKL